LECATDTRFGFGYNLGMSSAPQELNEQARVEYHARWEAVEVVKAHELAHMTEERALQIIRSLRLFAPAPSKLFNGEGLIKQQAVFHRRKG
jgi:hypothetical protein